MTRRPDPLVRTARWVGDFGHPFYDEERQRDVWNEASAFGFQLLLWLTLAAATVTVWVVGLPSVPYVLGALLLLGAVSTLTVLYAGRLGVDATSNGRAHPRRLLPLAVLGVVLVAGLLRAEREAGIHWSSLSGLLVGAAVGGLVAGLAFRRVSKRV